MKAVRVHELGGPEVLRYEEVEAPEPRDDEALVEVAACGVNYLDIYYRSGFHWGGHHGRALPYIPGAEGAGTVLAVGRGVSEVRVGDRVAYGISNGQGSYAGLATVPERHLVPVPEAVDLQPAAASMLQGMTAHYLTRDTYPVGPGDAVLVHAAAGGTGLLLVQMAKMRGARVFGTVSTPEKARIAEEAGAGAVIDYTEVDFAAEVRRLTDGRGVNVVYDSVGKSTFEQSLDALAPRGCMVIFGQSSGARAALRHRRAQCQGVALPQPPEPHPPHHRPCRYPGTGRRSAAMDRGRKARRARRRHASAVPGRRGPSPCWRPERPPARSC